MTLPKIDRRGWLALWAQGRRRARQHHLLPAPVLRAAYPDLLQWDWNLANPYKWNVWMSLDGGVSWMLIEDYWMYGDARQFAPDGGSELYYIVGVDIDGNEITEHSNVVRPDEAPGPNAPNIVDGNFAWGTTESGWCDVWFDFTFDHGAFPVANMEVWVSVGGGDYSLLGTIGSDESQYYYAHATDSNLQYDFKIRYVNGGLVGPFSNIVHVDTDG